MATWRQDITYAFRRLRKSPGFAAAAVLSIGLGIAANSTIFSMVSAFVLKPAPVGDPATLLSVYTQHKGNCCSEFSHPLFEDVRDLTKSFEGVAAYFPLLPASIGGKGEPTRVWGQAASANYFELARLRMPLGRGFVRGEEKAQVVVLSYGLWQRRFGADPSILGAGVNLSGKPFTVVGVTPAGFRGLDLGLNAELWVPLGTVEQLMPKLPERNSRHASWLMVTARIKDGVSREEAQAELTGLGARIAQLYPKNDEGLGFHVELAGTMMPNLKKGVMLFLGALSVVVLLVLCIACANVANLLLAQASARQKEMAVRLALGATRGQLIRQMLAESTMLALGGGLFGLVLSLWSTQALSSFKLPIPLPLDLRVGVDAKVLLYTFLLSVGTGLLFGLAPALAASRPILASALKGEDVLARPGRRWTMRNVLVVGQVAMSLTLLCATGLFLRSLQSASNIEIGFRSKGILMMAVDPRLHGYTPERTSQFLDQIRQRALGLPGVTSAAVTDIVPLSIGGTTNGMRPEGRPEKEGESNLSVDVYMASAGYFDTMGIARVAGRDFANESPTAPKVAIVNETLVKKMFPAGENPVGQRIVGGGGGPYEIIGVVKNTKSRTLGEDPRPMMYRAVSQEAGTDVSFMGYSVMVRTNGNAAALAPALRREIQTLDPNMAIFNAESMEEHLRNALFLPRLAGTLFGVFGGVGLLLAAVGLYGVMSYSVSRRRREIGIRMALGAQAGNVQGMIVKQGLVMTAIATVVGLAAALASAKLAAGILYGVEPHDVTTFVAVPVFLASVALLASWIPARRAAKVDPMTALRYE